MKSKVGIVCLFFTVGLMASEKNNKIPVIKNRDLQVLFIVSQEQTEHKRKEKKRQQQCMRKKERDTKRDLLLT